MSNRPEAAEAFELLAASIGAVARSDDLDEVLTRLLESLARRLGSAAAAAFLVDEAQGTLELVASVGVGSEDGRVLVGLLEDADDPLARAARERRPVSVDRGDAKRGTLLEHGELAEGLFQPLVVSRGGIELAVGVLALGWPDARPPADQLAPVAPLADLAAIAVDRSRALSTGLERSEWLERLAHIDPLTGLANRRTLDRMLELELARATRQGGEVTVALFRVDAFAATVEDAGNAAGDDLLRSVAAVLAGSVRLVDTVARYGGDEFLLVAPGATGTVVAERVLAGAAALAPVAGRPVSVSAGVVHFPRDGATADELIAAAVQAVVEAGAGGGGRIGTVPPA